MLGFELHWFLRWISTRMWSKWSSMALGVPIFVVFTILLPFAPFWILDASGLAYKSPGLAILCPAMTYVSHAMSLAYCIQDYPYKELNGLGERGFLFALMIHFGIGLAFMMAFSRSAQKARRPPLVLVCAPIECSCSVVLQWPWFSLRS